jgi:hypothetical protein
MTIVFDGVIFGLNLRTCAEVIVSEKVGVAKLVQAIGIEVLTKRQL